MTYEITGYWRFAQVVLDTGLQGWGSEGGRSRVEGEGLRFGGEQCPWEAALTGSQVDTSGLKVKILDSSGKVPGLKAEASGSKVEVSCSDVEICHFEPIRCFFVGEICYSEAAV